MRIRSFYEEVTALQDTYDALEKVLKSPIMAEAARVANQTSDGAHLWSQIRIALKDSTRTMQRVNQVLDQIKNKSGIGRSVKMQLQESLTSGELSRLRQRVQFFNATLSLPIQMVCVTLQLEQRGMSTEHQKILDAKLMSLERTMKELVRSLNGPSRSQTLDSSTVVASPHDELLDSDGIHTYITFAKEFLETASAAASTRSSLSSISPQIESDRAPAVGHEWPSENALPGERRARVAGWIPLPPPAPANVALNGFTINAGHHRSTPPSNQANDADAAGGEDDLEVAFMLTTRHLKLGQEKVEQDNHGGAEIHFRKALAQLQRHDFASRISFQPAEVVLMLSHACLSQSKLDEAASLLGPVAERQVNIFPEGASPAKSSSDVRQPCSQPPDRLQALAASHMLGQVYLQKHEYDLAERHSLKAFNERRKELGPQDEKTLESVRLVIEVYRAKGDGEEAEGYEVFLEPLERPTTGIPPAPSAMIPEERLSEPPTPSIIPQITPPSQRTKQSRPSVSSLIRHFGRSPRSNTAQEAPSPELQRLSISRTTTQNEAVHDIESLSPRRDRVRSFGSPSDTSTHEKTPSFNDDDSTTAPSERLERSSSSRIIEPTFQAVAQLCTARDYDQAVKVALPFLQTYRTNIMIVRKDEIKSNIRKGQGVGLASTGRGYSPLHFFADLRDEHPEEIGMLIKYGVNVNAVAYKAGYTAANPKDAFNALQLATKKGHENVTSLLLGVPGIKVSFKDSDGYTPLLVACRQGHHNIVKQFLDHSTFENPQEFPQTWYGNSLLHDAARHCDPVLVELLLDRGLVPVDQRDRFGKTPLMHAVIKIDIPDLDERRRLIRGRARTVQALMEAGADPTVKHNQTGLTIREYAEKEEDPELVALLNTSPRRRISQLLA